MEIKAFGGIDNQNTPLEFGLDRCETAINVDITRGKKLVRRQGREKLLDATIQAAFATGEGEMLYQSNGSLYLMQSDTPNLVRAGLSPSNLLAGTKLNGEIYWSNGIESGVITDGVSRNIGIKSPLTPDARQFTGSMPNGRYHYAVTLVRGNGYESGAQQSGVIEITSGGIEVASPVTNDPTVTHSNLYLSNANGTVLYFATSARIGSALYYAGDTLDLVDPLQTQFCEPPDFFDMCAFYRGRMYYVQNNVVFASKPFNFGLIDYAEDYFAFDLPITLFAPCNSGIYVATTRETHFLTGADIGEFQLNKVYDYGAIAGSERRVHASVVRPKESGDVTVWATNRGWLAGFDGGQVFNLTDGYFAFEDAERATTLLREENGQKHFIVTVYEESDGEVIEDRTAFIDLNLPILGTHYDVEAIQNRILAMELALPQAEIALADNPASLFNRSVGINLALPVSMTETAVDNASVVSLVSINMTLPMPTLSFSYANASPFVATNRGTAVNNPISYPVITSLRTLTANIALASVDGDISPNIFGTNLEWIEQGGNLNTTNTALKNKVYTLATNAGITNFRFSGGIFADYYDWRNGIGAIGSRPTINSPTDGTPNNNRFGSPELFQLCADAGAKPFITVNAGTGNATLAADWVQYCNAPTNAQRAADGFVSPIGVEYWEVGNELYFTENAGTPNVSMTPSAYAAKYLTYASAMKAVDPDIKLVAIGVWDAGRPDAPASIYADTWTETVLEAAADEIDLISVHNGYFPLMWNVTRPDVREMYPALFAAPELVKHALDELGTVLSTYEGAREIGICLSEWGALFVASGQDDYYVSHCKTMGSAIYAARMLQVFMENSRVKLTNYFKLTDNYFMGQIDYEGDAKVTYHAFKMIAQHTGTQRLVSSLDSPTFNTPPISVMPAQQNIKEVTMTASMSAGNSKVYLTFVNRSMYSRYPLAINFTEGEVDLVGARIFKLEANEPTAHNGRDLPSWWPSYTSAYEPYTTHAENSITIQSSTWDGVSPVYIRPFSIIVMEFDVVSIDSAPAPLNTVSALGYLGGNVSKADYVSNPFADLARNARGFYQVGTYSGTEVARDGVDGSPAAACTAVIVAATGVASFKTGVYKLSYNSMASVNISGSSNVTLQNLVQSGGVTTADLVVTAPPQIILNFGGAAPRLRIISPSETDSTVLSTEARNHYKQFNELRFMDWMAINGHDDTTWASRVPSHYRAGRNWESLIQFANEVYTAPDSQLKGIHICVPHLADSDYITNLAALFRDNLNAGLYIRVEWSNELWNSIFPQFGETLARSDAEGNANGFIKEAGETFAADRYTWFIRYWARAVKQTAQTFLTVFGLSNPNGRVRPVHMGQLVNTYWTTTGLSWLASKYPTEPVSSYLNTIGAANYVQGTYAEMDAATTVPQLEAVLRTTGTYSLANQLAWATAYKNLADSYGLQKPVAYEGGLHTDGSGNRALKYNYHISSEAGQLVSDIQKGFWQRGWGVLNYYHVTPATFTTASENSLWPSCQDFNGVDTKHAALLNLKSYVIT